MFFRPALVAATCPQWPNPDEHCPDSNLCRDNPKLKMLHTPCGHCWTCEMTSNNKTLLSGTKHWQGTARRPSRSETVTSPLGTRKPGTMRISVALGKGSLICHRQRRLSHCHLFCFSFHLLSLSRTLLWFDAGRGHSMRSHLSTLLLPPLSIRCCI